ncbi:MAG: sensor domain-containing diguanylate cyclase [Nitrospirae bacterium]|nr:sensor domain-containing diguanylate cyclase [Nitrospirota bacterium]
MNTLTQSLRAHSNVDDAHLPEELSKAFRSEQDRIDRLSSLIKVTALVNSSLDERHVLNSILEHATQVTHAEASSIILKGEDGHSLYFLAATGEKADEVKDIKLQIGEGIAGWVVQHGVPVLSPDVDKDPRFSPRVASSVNFTSRNIACAPMKVKARIIGAIEVLNRKDGPTFSDDDLEILEAFANQAALAIENARLFKLAITDELTGLYSHRYFKDYLRLELHKAKRLRRPLAVVLMDIDNFKSFNDTYGHSVGDEVLRGVSNILRKSLRDTDVIARYGGEEIAVILTELNASQSLLVSNRLREQIEAYNIARDGKKMGVTVSVGLSMYPESADNETDLFDRADAALYQAKRSGKNCVKVASV